MRLFLRILYTTLFISNINFGISQEFYFREAAKVIEKTVKSLEENYSVRDKQDLLAMCCIQFAAKNLQNKSKSGDSDTEVEKIILKMIDDIDKSILTS